MSLEFEKTLNKFTIGSKWKCIKNCRKDWTKDKYYTVNEVLDEKYLNGGIYLTTNRSKNQSMSVGFENKLKKYFDI